MGGAASRPLRVPWFCVLLASPVSPTGTGIRSGGGLGGMGISVHTHITSCVKV
jgi:hypothetical protein